MPRPFAPTPPFSRRRTVRSRRALLLRLEELETRTLLSGGGFTPSQIVHAYGIDKVTFTVAPGVTLPGDGRGQTIAIVDAYDDPTILSDLQTFDARYQLPDPGTGTFQFVKDTPQGLPPVNKGWDAEIALDVESAHAVAPWAEILLVEAKSSDLSDLLEAVDYAAGLPTAAVSMSWSTPEFAAETSAAYDGHFSGHAHTVFVAASGDTGAGANWPAASPNVVAVGGTSLKINPDGSWASESGWGSGSLSGYFGGSGGGISQYEPKPDYQSGVTQSATKRTSPDVAWAADPAVGFSVFDSQNGGWTTMGGTSGGAAQFAGLIAIADEGRYLSGQDRLGTLDVLGAMYAHPGDFHDITSGNNGYAAGPGYDLVTGLGTPIANQLIPDLVGSSQLQIFPSPKPPTAPFGTIQASHRVVSIGILGGGLGSPPSTAPGAPPGSVLPAPPTEVVPFAFAVVTPGPTAGVFQVSIFPAAASPVLPASPVRAEAALVPPLSVAGVRQESGAAEADPAGQLLEPDSGTDLPAGVPVPAQTPETPPAPAADPRQWPGTNEDWQTVAELTATPQVLLAAERTGWTHETAAAIALALFLTGPRALEERRTALPANLPRTAK